MRNPFAWITLYFSLGTICASAVHISFFAAWAIAVTCCVLCFCPMRFERTAAMMPVLLIALSCAVFFSGAACLINADTQPKDHIRYLVYRGLDDQCVAGGRVSSEPEMIGSRMAFDLTIDHLIIGTYSYGCSGIMRVILNGAMPLEHGQRVEVAGKLGLPSNFRSSRRSSIRERLRQRGVYAVLRVRSAHSVRLIPTSEHPGIIALCLRMKKKFQHIIHAYMPPIAAGIMEAMLLGDKKDIPRSVYNDMIKSGTVHILVVSGFNVGIVAGACALFLKVVRLNRIIRLCIIIPALVLYCIMTGASPPVVRATIMGIFFFFSWYVRRDPSVSQALSLSAFGILACAPRQLYNASFQLSFAAVMAISLLAPAIGRLVCLDKIILRPVRWIAGLSIVSFSAWLGTAGFIVHYFRIIAPVTVVANIFIPVIASLITLCGAGLIVFGFICPYIAYSFASVSEFLILSLLHFNGFLINIPGAYWRLP